VIITKANVKVKKKYLLRKRKQMRKRMRKRKILFLSV